MSQDELDGLFSYSYNVGSGTFSKRTLPNLVKLYNGTGSLESVLNSIYGTRDSEPKMSGLRTRRKYEKDLFTKGYNQRINKNKKLPIFYIIGEHSDFKAFNNLQKSTTIAKGAVNSVLDIRPYYNQDFGLFTIDEKTIEASNQFPPLSLPHLEFSSNSNHDMLLQMNINNIRTQSPILSFSTDNEGRKNAYLFGTGIWRWKLYNFHNEKKHDIFEELFAKSRFQVSGL